MKEVVVIGGGVIGLWSAYHLQKSGCAVTVVDEGNLMDGCSYGNAGLVVPSHFIPLASPGVVAQGIRWMFKKDSPFFIQPRLSLELAKWLWTFYRSCTKSHVQETMSLLRDMHEESREMYQHLAQDSAFDFGFEQRGVLMLYKSAKAEEEEKKSATLAADLGIEARLCDRDDLVRLEPGIKFSVRGAVHYPGDAHLDPQRFMPQMIRYLRSSGAVFKEQHHVLHVEDRGKNGCVITFSEGRKTEARHVVVCAGIHSTQILRSSGIRLPMQDGKGYSMNYTHKPGMPSIPSILHEARVALTPMGTKLRVAGTLEISGIAPGVNQSRVRAMLRAVPEYYPELPLVEEVPAWYGFRPCTPDGMPYIGRLGETSSLFVATGHAMMGLSLAPVTGRLVADEIMTGKKNLTHPKLLPGRFG